MMKSLFNDEMQEKLQCYISLNHINVYVPKQYMKQTVFGWITFSFLMLLLYFKYVFKFD